MQDPRDFPQLALAPRFYVVFDSLFDLSSCVVTWAAQLALHTEFEPIPAGLSLILLSHATKLGVVFSHILSGTALAPWFNNYHTRWFFTIQGRREVSWLRLPNKHFKESLCALPSAQ